MHLFHLRLAVGALLPFILGRLIAADMEVRRVKQFAHFINHIKDKLEGTLLAQAGRAVPVHYTVQGRHTTAKVAGHLAFQFPTSQPGISCLRRRKMGRHINLRHNHNAPGVGIGHDLPNILLGIKALMRLVDHVRSMPAVHLGASALRADLR